MTRVVVVTGGSAGVGRACAEMFARRGDRVALLARGQAGLDGAVAAIEASGRPRHRVPDRRGRLRAGREGRDPGRGGARADRRVGQRRDDLGARHLRRHRARRVPPGHRGHLPGLRLRHASRAGPDAPAQPGRDRAGRLRARLPRHPAAVRLLRRQARHPGLPRLVAHRAARRAQRCQRDDGADARAEHAAVRLGAVPAAAPAAAGAADLPARGRGARGGVRRGPPPSPGVLGGRPRPSGPLRRTRSPRRCSTATWPAPASRGSRSTSPRTPTVRTTCSTPGDAGRDHGAHGRFDARAHAAQPPALAVAAPRDRGRGRGWRPPVPGSSLRPRRVAAADSARLRTASAG